jgi:uncharacterized protein YjbI with pentapeptide repeats
MDDIRKANFHEINFSGADIRGANFPDSFRGVNPAKTGKK